jgi:mono/diheme cytochrome c family protein
MKLTVLFCFFAVVAAIAACGGNGANTATTSNKANNSAAIPAPSAAPSVDEMAAGLKLYKANCAACHRDNGTGGKVTIEGRTMKPDNLTDDRRKALSDQKILTVMHEGVEDEGMPAFKDKLSEAEMREIVRYVRVELQQMPDTGVANANSNLTSVNTNAAASNGSAK